MMYRWTDAMLDYIKDNYSIKSNQEIANEMSQIFNMSISYETVRRKAHEMLITKKENKNDLVDKVQEMRGSNNKYRKKTYAALYDKTLPAEDLEDMVRQAREEGISYGKLQARKTCELIKKKEGRKNGKGN